MAGEAGIASGCEAAERVTLTVLVVRHRDHRCLALLGEAPGVAGHALVGIEVERVALNRMRNDRRLVWVVAPDPHVIGNRPLHRRRGLFAAEWLWPAQP